MVSYIPGTVRPLKLFNIYIYIYIWDRVWSDAKLKLHVSIIRFSIIFGSSDIIVIESIAIGSNMVSF